MTKTIVIGLFIARFTLPLPFFNEVKTSQASVLTAFTSLFTGPQASASENDDLTQNSQKMPLLEAPVSSLIGSSTSINSVSDGVALLSTLTPTTPSPDPTPKTTNSSDTDTTDNSDTSDSSNKISTYKVESGDTVTSIAKQFNISINTVLWANNLRKDSTLAVGKNLIILPISGITYTVKKGDSLQSVAIKYKGDVQDIMAYNNMPNDQIKIGDMIVIPDGEATVSSSNSTPTQTTSIGIISKVAKAVGIKVANAESSDDDAPAAGTTVTTISSGYYMRPIKGGVKTQGIHGNNAVDLAEACGTPIYASADGSVTVAEDDGAWNGGYGNYVVLNHSNGSQTLYAHMSKVIATVGTDVKQGQEIGEIGNTGKVAGATGCHVHFEIRNGPVNPF